MTDKGSLFIVATPIGNMQDITLRAIETLKQADIIVCEDTRVTSKLLNKFYIKKPLIALNEFNEEQITHSVLARLEYENAALVSDSGTPLISDPGYRLVNLAKQKGIKVIPIPGPSALITALSASGLPTDKFVFLGFLPKSNSKAAKILNQYINSGCTLIFYESPHRIAETLKNLFELFGNIDVTIARELTKIHEEIFTLPVEELIAKYSKTKPKGEFVVMLSNPKL